MDYFQSDSERNWFDVKDIVSLDSPALLIFRERVIRNIETAITMIGDVTRLRPHVKTHKNRETSQLMLERGITKFKCATIAEARMLAEAGAKDILIAYQLVGPKFIRLISLIKTFPNISFSSLVDNKQVALEMSSVLQQDGLNLNVFIDIDLGMNRTGIEPGPEAFELYTFCNSLSNLRPVGLHAYDGHQREPQFEKRRLLTEQAFESVLRMSEQIENSGIQKPILIAGGSPTFSIHSRHDDRESSPGTFIYWDYGYDQLCSEQAFLTAAVLITRIISLPATGRICTDLGHKSVAAENEITRRIFFLNATDLTPVSQSEEHLVLETSAEHQYKVGDLLYALPYHVCPTVALYDRLFVVEKRNVTETWKVVARDRTL